MSTRCRSPAVEEVGELSLAWLTPDWRGRSASSRARISRSRCSCIACPGARQLWIHRFNHALIAGFGGLAAWYGFKLCLLNRTLTTPGLQINLAWLYASAVVAAS